MRWDASTTGDRATATTASILPSVGTALLVFAIASLALTGTAAANDDPIVIDSCTQINSSGIYHLGSDVAPETPEEWETGDSCVLINSSNVVLDGNGYTIDGSTVGPDLDVYQTSGILVQNESHSDVDRENPDGWKSGVTVRNVTLDHWAWGVRFHGVQDSSVEDVRVENSTSSSVDYEHGANLTVDGVEATGVTGTAIDLLDVAGGTVSDVTIHRNDGSHGAITAKDSTNIEIADNRIDDSENTDGEPAATTRAGITVRNSSGPVITNNTISGVDHGYGIRLGARGDSTPNALVERNNVSNVGDYSGIYLTESSGSTVTNNTLDDAHSIRVSSGSEKATGVTVSENDVSGGEWGVRLDDTSGTTVVDNAIVGPKTGIYVSNAEPDTIANNDLDVTFTGFEIEGDENTDYDELVVADHTVVGGDIAITSRANVTVSDVEIQNGRLVVDERTGDITRNLTVTDVEIRGYTDDDGALYVGHAENATILNTTTSGGENQGVQIVDSTDLYVRNVSVTEQGGSYTDLVSVSNTDNSTFRELTVADNPASSADGVVGLHVWESTDASFEDVAVTEDSRTMNKAIRIGGSSNVTFDDVRATATDSGAIEIYYESASIVAENVTIGLGTATETVLSFEASDIIVGEVASPSNNPDVTAIDQYFDVAAAQWAETPYLDVTLHYEEEDVAGVDEADLELQRYNDSTGAWKSVEGSTVDTDARTIAANVTDLSTVGAFAVEDEPEPAFFEVSGLSPTSLTVEQGGVINVSASVENTGEQEATQNVVLRVDGQTAAAEAVSLGGGDDQQVAFDEVDLDGLVGDLDPGTYEYGVFTDDDNRTGTLTVEEAAEPAVAIEHTTIWARATASTDAGTRYSSEVLAVTPADDETMTFGSGVDRSLEIRHPATGKRLEVTPQEGEGTYEVDRIVLDVYDGLGEIGDEPTVDIDGPDGEREMAVSVSGDEDLLTGLDSTFTSLEVALLDGGEVVDTTGERLVGIAYEGSFEQEGTTGQITLTLDRDEEVQADWHVEFSLVNTDVTTEVDHADGDDVFEFTVDVSETPSGDYTGNLELYRDAGDMPGERILNVIEVGGIEIEGGSVEPGTLRGTVSSEVDGEPIEGATVTATPWAGGTGVTDESDQAGSYEFESLEPGTYDVEVDADGYETTLTPVVVEAGETTTADLTMTPEAVPAPTFVDVDGHATAGGTVYASDDVDVVVEVTGDGAENVDAVTLVVDSLTTTYTVETPATPAGGDQWTATIDHEDVPDDGAYELRARAASDVGATNESSAAEVPEFDRGAPSMAAAIEDVDGDDATVVVRSDENLDGTPAVTAEAPDGTTTVLTVTTDGPREWSADLDFADSGEYAVEISGTDLAGNAGTDEASVFVSTAVGVEDGIATVRNNDTGTVVEFDVEDDANLDEVAVALSENVAAYEELDADAVGVGFLTGTLDENLSENLTEATIMVPVDETTLPDGVEPDDVDLHRYNDTTSTWNPFATTVEEIDDPELGSGQYWVATVDGFSTYGALAVDDGPPELVAVSPATGDTLDADTAAVTVRFEYRDELSSVDTGNVSMQVDGADVTADANTSITGSAAEHDLAVTDGTSFDVELTVPDEAGNEETFETAFAVEEATGENDDGEQDTYSGSFRTSDPDEPGDASELPFEDVQVLAEGVGALDVDETDGTARVDLDATPIRSIELDTADVDGGVLVSELDGEPAEIGPSGGATVATVRIVVPDEATDSPARIRSSVSVDRLDDVGADADDLRVSRYDDEAGQWELLPTDVIEAGDERVVVEAETPGFSIFSLSAVAEPDARMSASPASVAVGETVALDASESTDDYGRIDAYEWSVADERFEGETATVSFDEPGEYTVELAVTNDAGETATVSERVVVRSDETATPTEPSDETATTTETGGQDGMGIVVAVLAALLAVSAATRSRTE